MFSYMPHPVLQLEDTVTIIISYSCYLSVIFWCFNCIAWFTNKHLHLCLGHNNMFPFWCEKLRNELTSIWECMIWIQSDIDIAMLHFPCILGETDRHRKGLRKFCPCSKYQISRRISTSFLHIGDGIKMTLKLKCIVRNKNICVSTLQCIHVCTALVKGRNAIEMHAFQDWEMNWRQNEHFVCDLAISNRQMFQHLS